jgi:hypothetical protein
MVLCMDPILALQLLGCIGTCPTNSQHRFVRYHPYRTNHREWGRCAGSPQVSTLGDTRHGRRRSHGSNWDLSQCRGWNRRHGHPRNPPGAASLRRGALPRGRNAKSRVPFSQVSHRACTADLAQIDPEPVPVGRVDGDGEPTPAVREQSEEPCLVLIGRAYCDRVAVAGLVDVQ